MDGFTCQITDIIKIFKTTNIDPETIPVFSGPPIKHNYTYFQKTLTIDHDYGHQMMSSEKPLSFHIKLLGANERCRIIITLEQKNEIMKLIKTIKN